MIILPPLKNKKIVFLAAGNIMRADDAFGPLLFAELQTYKSDTFLPLDGGELPENMCGPIKKFRPHVLIMADAAILPKRKPGELEIVNEEDIANPSLSTHTLSLEIMLKFLKTDLPKLEVIFIAANAASTEFGQEPCANILKAIKNAKNAILRALND